MGKITKLTALYISMLERKAQGLFISLPSEGFLESKWTNSCKVSEHMYVHVSTQKTKSSNIRGCRFCNFADKNTGQNSQKQLLEKDLLG